MPYYPAKFYLAGVSPRTVRIQRRMYYIKLRRMGFGRAGAKIRTNIEFPKEPRR